MNDGYSHLTHIKSHDELALYGLIPNIVWIFDLDRHGWWWGNDAAIAFWGLETLDDLVNKDLSDDNEGARDRTRQTFDLAVKNGLTVDPWTTYPDGKPKTLHMMHRAVLVGPDRHRAIIAYINEEVNLGEAPENLLLVEAMRYTNVLITSYDLDGMPVVENPAATEAYKSYNTRALPDETSFFAARFVDPDEGTACLQQALAEKGGRWTYLMNTDAGARSHTLDIRMTRHPLNGDAMMLVAEYDVTPLHEALDAAAEAQDALRKMAHYDALTGLPSLHLLQESAASLLAMAERHDHKIAIMFIDLDGFKAVNDTWGHDAGDTVLKVVAQRLSSVLRDSDQVARLGGDEFVVLITEVGTQSVAQKVAQKIINELGAPIGVKDGDDTAQAHIGASIGIAFYPDHGKDMETLLKVADKSMYNVKGAGKGTFHFA